ncbi:MAG: polysaccharide deacetylase family protein, partial [Acidobacteriota bacterium]
ILGFLDGPRRYVSARSRTILLEDDGDDETRGWDYMTWLELDDWVASGGHVGGHTLSHPYLGDLGEEQGIEEIAGCRQKLEARYGSAPELFCYPYGDHRGDVPAWVRRAGFRAAVTTEEGVVDRGGDPFRLPRVPAPAAVGAVFGDLLYGVFRWRHLIRRVCMGEEA